MATLIQDSTNITLDTRAPQTISVLNVTKTGGSQAFCTWNAATDQTFDHYEIWYGTNESDVQNRNAGPGAALWGPLDDANLNNIATINTTVTGITPGSTLFFSIFAVDSFGHETRVDAVGSLVMYDEAQVAFDGSFIVQSTISSLFNAYIKVFETNPNHFFGYLRVYDVVTELLDGDFHVGLDASFSFDGNISVEELAENQFNGSIYIVDTVLDLFDGFVDLIANVTSSFDGFVDVHEVATDLLNGSLFVFSVVTNSFDGKLELQGVGAFFDGQLDIEALPVLSLLRPRNNAENVQESTFVHIEFEGFPSASGGGLDSESVIIVMLAPELITIYDGSTPGAYPDVAVSGDSSRLAFDFKAPLEDELFPSNTAINFDLFIANEAGQSVSYTYNFDTRTGPEAAFRRGEAVYEYDMGTDALNIKEFKWDSDGLVKMRLKFSNDRRDLRQLPFEGEEHEVFAGTTINTSIWDISAPLFTLSQNEVLRIEGTQSGASDIWDNETRLNYAQGLPRSYNVAIDTRLNIIKSAVQGARSFLEVYDAIGNVIRIEKIYRGLATTSTDGTSVDIVSDENTIITGNASGVLSASSVFPQSLSTVTSEVVIVLVNIVQNDITLAELERLRIKFSGAIPTTVDITVNGTYSVNNIVVNSLGFFEVTESALFASVEAVSEEVAEQLTTVQFVFQAPDSTTTISDLEVLSTAQILDTRLRVMVNNIEEFNINSAIDPLRFDQLKIEVEANSFDVFFNGISVYRKYMKLNNPRFAIGAGARNNGDSFVAEFNNLVIRRYFDRSPVMLNRAQRYAAYEVTMKAPEDTL